ncbi:exosortase-associated protein EpsI, B-type [Paucibacter sp. XJ19-41]|uniref:exosortase-associated protein EpsI, B-type n=1 Tax=Paucibacter sp. XJ19-41 TaxID=2927824 RepID=UPI00234AF13F|nr:exosortase-associated protein EpsI, B-type [Paucibacter sp. XJ19-41]MDC6166643.1 EpsI family protein [Paucibacter sp. XJ19-41]
MNNTPKSQVRRASVALVLMAAAAAVGWKLTPTTRMATLHGEFELEQIIPSRFGDWQQDTTIVGGVVNPQQEELLNQLYSQILSRTYVNSRGQRIMLSIAYGNDQRDSMQMHYPEICYPAQGFQLKSNKPVDLQLAGTAIPARRLETVLGNQRYEPVTYWTVIGEKAVRGGINKKFAEMEYGFRDLIPDGLLFRVSTIDRDSVGAFVLQDQFAAQMLAALTPQQRQRLAGSGLSS